MYKACKVLESQGGIELLPDKDHWCVSVCLSGGGEHLNFTLFAKI